MAKDFMPGGDGLLGADEIDAYGVIASGEWRGIPEVNSPQVQKLARLGFVTINPNCPNIPVALDPKEAARRCVANELEEAEARVARLKALPEVADRLLELYERNRWGAGGGSEWIDDAAVVNARLDDVVGSAKWEILAAQPGGPRKREVLERAIARDSAALDRGVSLRTVYRATVRCNALTAEYARTMSTRAGKPAEYRTLVGPFERAIVVDRRVAFISNHLIEGAPEHAAWVITDRAMVAYIVAEYEAKWRRADVWMGERSRGEGNLWENRSSGDGARTTRRQREIMREIVEGRDQKAIAQRLGLSLRTVTAEITELKDLLGASSLPGLAYKWASLPDRLVDDSAPTAEATAATTVTDGETAA